MSDTNQIYQTTIKDILREAVELYGYPNDVDMSRLKAEAEETTILLPSPNGALPEPMFNLAAAYYLVLQQETPKARLIVSLLNAEADGGPKWTTN